MKLLFTAILYFSFLNLFAQKLDSCGLDNNILLAKQESFFLNEYLKTEKKSFDFTNKKVVFVSGSSGKIIESKQSFFNAIKNCPSYNKVSTSVIILTEDEKIKSGGVDAICLFWVKLLLTKKQRKHIIEKLKILNQS